MGRNLFAAAMIGALSGAALLGAGCVGFQSYPPVGGDFASNNPNSSAMTELMIESMRWVRERHPSEGPYAISFPEGMLRKRTLQIVERIDDPEARAMAPGLETWPTYHIARIWVRGDEAEVDVFRPVMDLSAPDGQGAVHQAMTLSFRGGVQPWRVVSHRTWMIGALNTPPLHYLPDKDTQPLGPGSEAGSPYRSAAAGSTDSTGSAPPDMAQPRQDEQRAGAPDEADKPGGR